MPAGGAGGGGGLTSIVVGGAYQELESTSILSLKEEKCILTEICFGQSGKKMIEGNMIRRDQQIFYPATYLYRKVLFGVIIFFLKCRVRGGGGLPFSHGVGSFHLERAVGRRGVMKWFKSLASQPGSSLL